MKKVSIIVPIYNEEKNIEKCVQSLINQTYSNLEIILLNDGSTDKTKEIIEQFKDKRITIINKENTGIGDTRNQGIKKSKGYYLMFVDSDDYLKLDCIQKCVEKLEKDKSDMVTFNYYLETPSKTIEMILPDFKITSSHQDSMLLTKIHLGPCTKLFKSSLIKNNDNFFPINIKYEDVPFVAQAIVEAQQISHIPDFLYHYVIKKSGETITRDERLFDILKICDILKERLKDHNEVDITSLFVKILSYYLKNSRYITDKKIQKEFINAIYDYLNNIDKNWRKCSYLKNETFIKRLIITSKPLLKMANILKK